MLSVLLSCLLLCHEMQELVIGSRADLAYNTLQRVYISNMSLIRQLDTDYNNLYISNTKMFYLSVVILLFYQNTAFNNFEEKNQKMRYFQVLLH